MKNQRNHARRHVGLILAVVGLLSGVTLMPGPTRLASALTDDEVSLNDTDACEPVEPDSPEGQMILVEAVRSLERRLSPEARATICAGQNTLAPNRSNRNSFCLKLQSLYQLICPKALRFARKKQ